MDYADSIEADLRWREEELASLKNQARRPVGGSTAQSTLLRSLLAMLYAHYEGFCLFALRAFLEHIEAERIICEALRHEVLLFALEERFRTLRKATPPSAELYRFWSEEMPALLATPVRFERDRIGNEYVLEGRSNLRPGHIDNHCETLGIPKLSMLQNAAEKARLWQLVERRNAIAHGRQLVVHSLSEYQPYEDAAILAMHELAVAIIEAIESRLYLKPSVRDEAQLQLLLP